MSAASGSTKGRGACRGTSCSCTGFVPGGMTGGWQGCAACPHVRETHLVVKASKAPAAEAVAA